MQNVCLMYSVQFTARSELLHCVQVKDVQEGFKDGMCGGYHSSPFRASGEKTQTMLQGQVTDSQPETSLKYKACL